MEDEDGAGVVVIPGKSFGGGAGFGGGGGRAGRGGGGGAWWRRMELCRGRIGESEEDDDIGISLNFEKQNPI